jgi:hypothetical protein
VRAHALTRTHTETHVQLSLDIYICWDAINLIEGVHLRTKCNLKDTFPSRDRAKTQSIYLRTCRSYPEEWNLERNPISLQKWKFSLKFNHHHYLSVMELGHLLTRSGLMYPEASSFISYLELFLGLLWRWNKNCCKPVDVQIQRWTNHHVTVISFYFFAVIDGVTRRIHMPSVGYSDYCLWQCSACYMELK